MTAKAPISQPDSKLLAGSSLMYLNYPPDYREKAYRYLLGEVGLDDYNPEFDLQTLKIINSYDDSVKQILETAKGQPNAKLARKLREVALIKAYRKLYETGQSGDFQLAVEAIWGYPRKALFFQLLDSALSQAGQKGREGAILKEVRRLVRSVPQDDIATFAYIQVSHELFHQTQDAFSLAFRAELELLKKYVLRKPRVHRYNPAEIKHLLETLVRFYALDKQGWTVEISSRAERVMVTQDTKTIHVAPTSFRLSHGRVIGLVLHEVAVHLNSAKTIQKYAKLLGERRVVEEGLGVFVEQMMFDRLHPVRSLRYIALGLALGFDGRPRNAKEVFEVIWRLRYLSGIARTKRAAKEYAVKEVIRIFRGMPLTQKGVVITKDRAYVEGNQLIWKYIQENGPEFIFRRLLGKSL